MTPHEDLVPVWSGAMEKAGAATGLSTYTGASCLSAVMRCAPRLRHGDIRPMRTGRARGEGHASWCRAALLHRGACDCAVEADARVGRTAVTRRDVRAAIETTADSYTTIAHRLGVSKSYVQNVALRLRAAGVVFAERPRGARRRPARLAVAACLWEG